MVKFCIQAVTIPVMLKTRLGWDKKQQNIIEIAQDFGVKSLTIHRWTRADSYMGASYDLIAAVKERLSIPVFFNEDINTPEVAKHVLYTKADGLYIGRGALGKDLAQMQVIMLNICNTFMSIIFRIARKHVKWYWQHAMPDGYPNLFTEFSKIASASEQIKYVLQNTVN